MSLASTAKHGLHLGTPDIKSTGPLAFGPEGILFLADNLGARIFAIDIGDDAVAKTTAPVEMDRLDSRLAALLGCDRKDILVRDIAVHPTSQNVYLSVQQGYGASARPFLIRTGTDGKLSQVSLKNVPFSETAIQDAPSADDQRRDVRVIKGDREGELVEGRSFKLRIAREVLRTVTVTDMAYINGVLVVAGASNEEFSSTLRRIPFPFDGKAQASSLEIFHVSHGKYETASPIRTFVPYKGNTSVLASYTCTPVVHFALGDLKPGAQVKGRTVAELGAGSTPLDIISYKNGTGEYVLVSNSRHPLMKIAAWDIDAQGALTQPKEPLGVPRQDLPHPGVTKMANLNGAYVLMMQEDEGGNLDLKSYATASL